MKIKIFYNFLLLRKSWIHGITIYPFIFFKQKKEEVTDRLFRHELEHIYQVNREGWFKFYLSYLWESIRHGYKNNKYELAAEVAEQVVLTEQERQWKENS